MHKPMFKNLKDLASEVLAEMKKAHYCRQYIQQVRSTCMLLGNMADRMGKDTLDDALSQAFLDDSAHFRTGAYSEPRFKRHKLCIRILRTYRETGSLERPSFPHVSTLAELTAPQLIEAHASFTHHMKEVIGLKKNTIDGYKRFVYHFLLYCEKCGCSTIGEIQSKDVLSFFKILCRDRYQPTSIGAHLSGLKLFFAMSESTRQLLATFPKAPKSKREIIPVLERHEHEAFTEYLETANLSARNRAVCWLAFETGMRAVDICTLSYFTHGVEKYASNRDVSLSGYWSSDEPNFENGVKYVKRGLSRNSPVALITFYNPKLSEVEWTSPYGTKEIQSFNWHWVTITSITEDLISQQTTIKVSSWGGYAILDLREVIEEETICWGLMFFEP